MQEFKIVESRRTCQCFRHNTDWQYDSPDTLFEGWTLTLDGWTFGLEGWTLGLDGWTLAFDGWTLAFEGWTPHLTDGHPT